MVSDDQDGIGLKIIDRNQNAPHYAAKRVGDNGSGIFDDLCIAVPKVEGFGEKLRQPRIHAGEDDHPLVGEPIGDKGLVALLFYEGPIVADNLANLIHEAILFVNQGNRRSDL